MQYNKLGNSELKVSRICLGSMTWGEQNTQDDAFEQLDYALEQGVNFIDTAEVYAVPPRQETYGLTETCIGNWLHQRQCRDKVIIATKVAGPGRIAAHVRGGSRLDKTHINQAIEGSLKRLQTDYIDLYQLHWPHRNVNCFGQLGYVQQASEDMIEIEESLTALDELVKQGKVRYIGVSNESAWGVMTFLKLAEQLDLASIVSIQNPYNLLNRSYEVGLAEVSHRENVGLLAYSPLAFGVLSGKYLNGYPENARISLFPYFDRYVKHESGIKATQAYVNLARQHELDPAQMALAYVNSRPFLHASIIGATNMTQLKDNIASIDVILSEEVLAGIEAIHEQYSNPCP